MSTVEILTLFSMPIAGLIYALLAYVYTGRQRAPTRPRDSTS